MEGHGYGKIWGARLFVFITNVSVMVLCTTKAHTMSSLLLSRLSRHCLRKQPALGVSHLVGARFLSETPLCHIYGVEPCGHAYENGRRRYPDIGRLMITDFSGPSCWTRVLEKTVPLHLMRETGTMGASYGWVFTMEEDGKEPRLVDDFNPGVSESDGCEISLPDLVTLPHCQTRLVTNVAMSSSSPDDEDCILAVKFAGPQLSLCRPAEENSKWVNIRIDDPGFFSSRVIYSKKDKKFAMPSSEGAHIGYWDLGENLEKPKGQHFSDFYNIPELLPSDWERLDSCCTSVELVESRTTDEMFMVKRFRERNGFEDGRMEERQIWVFQQDSSSQWCYIQNIGDLCIFLSESEPFCLKASSHQKCKNSIYFLDKSERGIFILDDKCMTSNFNTFTAPYFIPPQSYLDEHSP